MAKKKPTFEETFEPLRTSLIPSLERHAHAILKDAQYLCDEAISKTWEKALNKYPTFNPERGDPSRWIHGILENTCISELRKLTTVGSEPDHEKGGYKKTPVRRFVEPKEGETVDNLMDAAKKDEWLKNINAADNLIDDYPKNPPEGFPVPPSIEEYMKLKEEIGRDNSRCVYDDDGERIMVSLKGEQLTWYRFKKKEKKGPLASKTDNPVETPSKPEDLILFTEEDITLLSEMVKKTSRKKIAKKLGKTPGTVGTAIHRLMKGKIEKI